jgi:methylenetetrahydrofolate reductase (NADPH)
MQPVFSALNVSSMSDTAISRHSLAESLRGYSVEINPSHPKVVGAAAERLAAGTEVFLPWIPGTDPMDTVGPAAKLRHAGLTPVPHIGARHLESVAQLEQFVRRLAGEAGVDRVLIVGGDRATPAGPYDSSLAVMQSDVLQRVDIVRVAIGGFPEGNPNIPDPVLDRALAEKADFARRAGLQLTIVTQFCFEAEPIVTWLTQIRAQGIEAPARVGLAGPAGLVTLARYAVHCGIGNSLHALTSNPAFARLLIEKGPEPIIRGILAQDAAAGERASQARGREQSRPLGIAGLHFYVFGGFGKTIDWIDAQRAQ